jgi:hypothetical protein
MNIIDSKWVYKIKRRADGSLDRYKACLVAKGFKQQYGVDYEKTFSLVVKAVTIRVILSLAISNGWMIQHLDGHNAFLHGFLEQDVYMHQPPGYEDKKLSRHVCKLDKVLYVLKQAPWTWYARLITKLLQLRFQISKADNCLFYLKNKDVTMLILVYVDDIIITSSKPQAVSTLLQKLGDEFALKDLGDLHFFLRIEVKKVKDGIILLQDKYTGDLLKRVGMSMCKLVSSPLVGGKLVAHVGTPLGPEDEKHYRSIVGALQYLTLTRFGFCRK